MFLLISPVATPWFPCSRFLSTTALLSLVVSCFSPKETNIIRTRYGSVLFSSLCFLHYIWSYFVLLLASGSVLMLSLSSSLLFSVEMKALIFCSSMLLLLVLSISSPPFNIIIIRRGLFFKLFIVSGGECLAVLLCM